MRGKKDNGRPWQKGDREMPPKMPPPRAIHPAPQKQKVKIEIASGYFQGEYHARDSAKKRHVALKKAVDRITKSKDVATEREAYNKVIRRVNVLSIFNKNKNPDVSEIFRKDMEYLQRLRDS